jgi:hypothetical protein
MAENSELNRETPEKFRIRLATLDDADVIAWHRTRMFQDMGDLPAHLFEAFVRDHASDCAICLRGAITLDGCSVWKRLRTRSSPVRAFIFGGSCRIHMPIEQTLPMAITTSSSMFLLSRSGGDEGWPRCSSNKLSIGHESTNSMNLFFTPRATGAHFMNVSALSLRLK